jgi:energy-coupling factor transporter ATP-binding protein EcfA2
MPANLTPQYLDADKRFRQAKTAAEKIGALEDMLALIPKHKGTEKMQADLKRRLSKAREEAQKKGKAGARGNTYHVPREGAGQVVVVGPPNSGKSTLLAMLTNAIPEVGDYPFTTRKPLPGMIDFENIKIQLVDLPPIAPEWTEGWVFALIRNADLVLVLVDLASDDVFDQVEQVRSQLAIRYDSCARPVVRALREERSPSGRCWWAIKRMFRRPKSEAPSCPSCMPPISPSSPFQQPPAVTLKPCGEHSTMVWECYESIPSPLAKSPSTTPHLCSSRARPF